MGQNGDLSDVLVEAERLYDEYNSLLTDYYNKPYNYIKLVGLMNTDMSKLLSTDFINKVFKAKQSLHMIERKYVEVDTKMTLLNSKIVIEEYRQTKRYRQEAISGGMETETAISAHTKFRMTDFYSTLETFLVFRNSIETLRGFFHKESINVDGILSQGKSLAYSGIKYNDDTGLFGYETE
jgi:hypothetical protein